MVTGGVTMKKHAEDVADIDTDTTTDGRGRHLHCPSTRILLLRPTLTWSVEGADQDKFDISNGELTFKDAPNYEMPGGRGSWTTPTT